MAGEAEELRRRLPTLSKLDKLAAYERLYILSLEEGTLQEQLEAVNAYLQYARHEHLDDAEVDALSERAVLYYNNDLNDSVLIVVRSDLSTVGRLGKYYKYYEIWALIANTYIFMNHNEQGLRETQAMYDDARQRGNEFGMGLAYCIMGTAYSNQRNFEQAIDAFDKSIGILTSLSPLPPVLPDAFTYYADALNDAKSYARLEALTQRWSEVLPTFFGCTGAWPFRRGRYPLERCPCKVPRLRGS